MLMLISKLLNVISLFLINFLINVSFSKLPFILHYTMRATLSPEILNSISTGDGVEASRHQVALGTGAILGIIIAVFFIFLIIVDISCYVMNDCGVINSICVRVCNKPPGGAKDLRNCEEGERYVT